MAVGLSKSCQIDILIQTEFLAYAIEVKRRKAIGIEVIEEMESKLKRSPRREDVTVRKALVYDGKLSAKVEERRYFDALIPSSALLA